MRQIVFSLLYNIFFESETAKVYFVVRKHIYCDFDVLYWSWGHEPRFRL